MTLLNRRTWGALFFAAGLCCAALPPVDAATVDIKVENVAGKGKVSVAVCDRERFLKQCTYTASVPAEAGTVKVSVPDVPPGTFAVLAYEDANDNGQLDRTLGIPTENWGMSRDARANFGPPTFEDAAVEVKEEPTVVSVRLR
ncbi:DUF2141 domain-containing protein [Massilia sp. METH4]|uniref:DUF2141 domain-containing protein n=1 Tax=Massilia sp. METH4 TaxID=3123041 RepID=UPI0030D4EA98